MRTYKYIIVGNVNELQTIEKAINAHFSRYYHATPKRINSNNASISFSVNLSLLWGESFEKVLSVAIYRGLKNSGILNSDSWLVDIL